METLADELTAANATNRAQAERIIQLEALLCDAENTRASRIESLKASIKAYSDLEARYNDLGEKSKILLDELGKRK